MLIAISGSQGSGKSTIVNALKEMGHRVIGRKTSRSILDEWGVSLGEVNNNHELTLKFQAEITKRKWEDEKYAALNRDTVYFTERTHADVFTYALIALGKDNEHDEWVRDYYKTCLEYNQWYHRVYYLRAGMFHVEHDGVRGSNPHYSRMADVTMLDFTKQMIHPSKLSVIETADLEQRIQIINLQNTI